MITLYLMDSNINELFIYFNITFYHTLVLILNIIKTLVLFPSVLVCNKLNTIISRNKS